MKNIVNMFKSLFSAVLGVRKEKDAEADFEQFDYRHYVAAGVIVVLVIIGLLMLLVKWVLPPL